MKCKLCGQPIKAAPVFHTECWEKEVQAFREKFCDEYCKFPYELEYEALVDKCEHCPMARLIELGGKNV